ncbi:hypothetical protein [Streptomyces sp. SP17KL33]|uniref:hypothetical protein n=1 Tax=Streptomyces sp. SP17KL33 TaxID=3002534 RepID=UPI002E769D85|nr:hypothetical protein [Streptomyces sp. SP17KL33]MEE1835771.1 hypothetical protein [Streptomyces sp. SP17KL33]
MSDDERRPFTVDLTDTEVGELMGAVLYFAREIERFGELTDPSETDEVRSRSERAGRYREMAARLQAAKTERWES